VISEAEDGSARMDLVASGANIETFAGHASFVDVVAVSPTDYTFATGSRDGTVRLWSTAPVAGSSYVPFSMLTWAAYSPDGRTLAVAEQTTGSDLISEGGLAFYDDEQRTYQEVRPHHHDYIRLGAFSPDNTRLVTVSQGDSVFQHDGKQILEPPMLMLWDLGKRELVTSLGGHTDRVNSAVFSPDSRKLLTASNDGTARLWDAATGSLLATLSSHTGIVHDAVFSADGNRIVTVSQDRTAGLWDSQGHLIKKLDGHTSAIRTIAFSPDSSLLVTGSDDFSIRVWHSRDGTAAAVLIGHGGPIASLAFPGNARVLSASGDGTVRLWDLETSQPLVISDKRSYNGGQGAASSDGVLVSMSWGDAEVHVFDTASGKLTMTLKTLPSEQVQNFVPKSHLLMVTSNYGTEFWRLPAGEKIGEVTLPFAMGQTFYISPAGDRVAVRDRFGLRDMSIWPTTSLLLDSAKRFSTHELSRDERYRRFLQ
jgi:WD40 repeat protein